MTELLTLPKHINILGQKFRVREIHGFKDDDGSELAGDCVGDYYRIQVNADNDNSKKWRTLLHESLHGALYINGVGSEISEELQEVIVQTLEHSVTQFMRQHGKRFLLAIDGDE